MKMSPYVHLHVLLNNVLMMMKEVSNGNIANFVDDSYHHHHRNGEIDHSLFSQSLQQYLTNFPHDLNDLDNFDSVIIRNKNKNSNLINGDEKDSPPKELSEMSLKARRNNLYFTLKWNFGKSLEYIAIVQVFS